MKSFHLRERAKIAKGSISLNPEDKEFKETIKNARKKLVNIYGSCYALQILWRRIVGSSASNNIKKRLAYILEQIIMKVKAAVGQGKGENLEKISAWRTWQKSEVKRSWSMKQGTLGRKSSFCIIDGHMSFEKCWVGGKAPQVQKVELYSEVIL